MRNLPSENDIAAARLKAELLAEMVAPIYRMLDWRWGDAPATPTKGEIAAKLKDLIGDLMVAAAESPEATGFWQNTGGLTAKLSYDEDGIWDMELFFHVSEWIHEGAQS